MDFDQTMEKLIDLLRHTLVVGVGICFHLKTLV